VAFCQVEQHTLSYQPGSEGADAGGAVGGVGEGESRGGRGRGCTRAAAKALVDAVDARGKVFEVEDAGVGGVSGYAG